MKTALTDQDFVGELRRGPLGRDLERERETQRTENKKRIIKEREAMTKKFEAELPKLQSAEDSALAEFRDASVHLEKIRAKADTAYYAGINAQATYEKRLAALNGELVQLANPLWRELSEKLRQLAGDARKIHRVSEERENLQPGNIVSLSKQKSLWTNRAAIYARMLLPPRIINAIHESVMNGNDSDNVLLDLYERSLDALPGPEVLRLDDQIVTTVSPRVEDAFEDFSERLDAALKGAIDG